MPGVERHNPRETLGGRMSLAIVHSRALLGLSAPEVTVEVHLATGLPSFTLVGLADTEVKESRERVRAALATSGLDFPANRRITVNLAPADLPKEGGRFDLPVALGILAASGQIDALRLADHEFAGELSLAGELRPVRGALALGLAVAREAGTARTLVLPAASAAEAALVPGTRVLSARHLLDVVGALRADGAQPLPEAVAAEALGRRAAPDLRDVRGQAAAKRALEIAAAGAHNLLMVGPPGSGKSMLAHRLPGLLPPMTPDEALESAAVLSVAGEFDAGRWAQRSVRAPHHGASAAALVGGGATARPGEVSLAHQGVLFLDELPEFQRSVLEALREPMETGVIQVSRVARRVQYPARFQLVAAMNPCPCGHLGSALRACRCTPDAIARYQGRLSGPLLDRIDLQVEVPALAPETVSAAADGEPSALIAARVAAARTIALKRQGSPNAELSGEALDRHASLDEAGLRFLHQAAARLQWSARGIHRVLRIARTIADLAGTARIATPHLGEAIQYRRVLIVS
jgi:magnesium chelatase family protein